MSFPRLSCFSALDTHTVRILDEKGYPVSQPAFSQEKEGKILKASFEILTPGFYTLELDATKIQDQWDTYYGGHEAGELSEEELMVVAAAYQAGSGLSIEQQWEEGHAGGYGREAIQNRVAEHNIYRLLELD